MKEVYGSMALDNKKIYTTDDIMALPDDVHAELIEGEIFYMAAPTLPHQGLQMELAFEIRQYIKQSKKKCKVYAAPAVFIKRDKYNYFEPDLVVICPHNENDDRLQTNGCHGAPDWVIEIVSPSSRTMDYLRKLNKYQETGVREYWIVDAKTESVLVYQFGEHPATHTYTFEDTIPVGIYEDFSINFKELDFRLE